MESAIIFKDVYKEYPFYQHITAGFKSFLFNLPNNLASLNRTKFVALNDVSFDVKKSETLGIIGKNGSGKSTILSLMAGVIKEDRGVVKTYGKISSLLELGAGFHPDLSGMENIILNGILMGNTREEVLEKIDRVVEFSELGDFIYQPLRTYSSGMQVRLGFSVAVHIDPEILLVDEALAVGDLNFQEKCMKKMGEFRESGATIVLVSHDMASIAKLCDRALWIDGGNIMAMGRPQEVIMEYVDRLGYKINIFEEEQHEKNVAVASPDSGGPSAPGIDAAPLTLPGEGAGGRDEALVAKQTPESISWWDSPLIAREFESIISGDAGLSFYEFLKMKYTVGSMDRGLSICNRLRGVEESFIINNICKSFDVVGDEERIIRLLEGRWNFKAQYYDLFLSVDFLHRVKDLDLFLPYVERALKDKGVVIAFEYIGPRNFQWSRQDLEIAEKIYRVLRGGETGESLSEGTLNSGFMNMPGAANPKEVISSLEKVFDVAAVRYFGGPLTDILLEKVLKELDLDNEKDLMLARMLIHFEQILIGEGVLKNHYAMIVARKRAVRKGPGD